MAPADIAADLKALKVCVVGAGGIGCELLKNLVQLGVGTIHAVDLDEIDVSNLNRQFLFRKEHVNKPKAEIAAQAVQQFGSSSVVPHYGSIFEPRFGIDFFAGFDAVINALDNLAARRHVNRICLAAEKPLIEGGSTGYLGQASVIFHKETECYECVAKPAPKVYPYCSIRSSPEKPIHCIIWGKHLFDLIFGPEDEGNMLSDCKQALDKLTQGGDVAGAAQALFTHLFDAEIKSLLEMTEDVQKEGKEPPRPLSLATARTLEEKGEQDANTLKEQVVMSVAALAQSFVDTLQAVFKERADQVGTMQFSKDDPLAVDFVTAAANLRMWNFHIPNVSRWDIQSMAGSIVPAIATTNAIVAGLQTMQLVRIVRNRKRKAAGEELAMTDGCRTSWVQYPEPSATKWGKAIVMPTAPEKPRESCFVCGSHHVGVTVTSFDDWTFAKFGKQVLVGALGALSPSVYKDAAMLFETPEPGEEPDEDDGLHPDWPLARWGLERSGQLLMVEDELQTWSVTLTLREEPLDPEEHPQGFRVDGAAPPPKPEKEPEPDPQPAAKRARMEVVEVDD